MGNTRGWCSFFVEFESMTVWLITFCVLTFLGDIVSLLMYIKSVIVEYNKSEFCKLLILLYRPCLFYTNKAVRL